MKLINLGKFCCFMIFVCLIVGVYYLEYIGAFFIWAGFFLIHSWLFYFVDRLNYTEDKLKKIQSSIEDKRGNV